MAQQPQQQPTLERTKNVPIDTPYGLGNLLLPVMLFYHPSMKGLAEKITLEVEKKKLQSSEMSVSSPQVLLILIIPKICN